MNSWQPVYRDHREHRTAIVKATLEDNCMKPILINRKISAYGIGDIEVLVAPDEVIRAIKVIKEDVKFE